MKKIKLKALVALLANAKTAWQEKFRAKAKPEEIAEARKRHDLIAGFVDAANADAKSEDDDIEVPADIDSKAAPKTDDENVVELKDIEAAIKSAVEKSMSAKIKELGREKEVTEDSIKSAVAAAFAEHAKSQPRIDKAKLEESVKSVVDAAFSNIKRTSKMEHDQNDGRKQIEIPYSLSSGNLSPSMKQLKNLIQKKHIDDGIDSHDKAKMKENYDLFMARCISQGAKALTTGGTGTGTELRTTELSQVVYETMFMTSKVAQVFMQDMVDMPSDPFAYGLVKTRPTVYINNAQGTQQTVSTPTTAGITLTTARFTAKTQISYEMEEDAVNAVLPLIQRQLGESHADALENALINGDTTSTHLDTGETVATNDQRRAWKGFRKLAIAGSLTDDWSTGGIVESNIGSLVGKMGKYAVDPMQLIWVVGTKAYAKTRGLTTVMNAYASGLANSTFITGAINAPFGGTILPSAFMRETLNANGVYDNSTLTKGSYLAFNRGQFLMGVKRRLMIEANQDIDSQLMNIVSSMRVAFTPVETPSSTVQSVYLAINYTA